MQISYIRGVDKIFFTFLIICILYFLIYFIERNTYVFRICCNFKGQDYIPIEEIEGRKESYDWINEIFWKEEEVFEYKLDRISLLESKQNNACIAYE